MKTLITLGVSCLALQLGARAEVSPLPFVVPPTVADRQEAVEPDGISLRGYLGSRIAANTQARLLAVDEDRLLEGYRQRPGRQAWDGEHVGKWLHAATLAWAHSGDAALRAKLDRVVRALLSCQLEDGYLGTYLREKRWQSWDVWAHKYNLIGLTTYMRYTGDRTPLAACRRMADLLCRDLGDRPGQRSLLEGSPHFGMAHGSVLEPIVLLYRLTAEPRYLEFARYILRAWDEPGGPRVISDLLAGRGVHQVANAKAYEMLSCLNGALELYRVTGDERLLRAARQAWSDIVAKRLYLTGTCSHHEHFHGDYELPNGLQNVGETCVTVTWEQFNAQLLRLTGEAVFAEELERTCYNHLLGAQQPDGSAWGYYVQLEGRRKPFSQDLSGHCCLSSGPRGVALIPTFAITTDADGVVVNVYERGEARLAWRDGRRITLATETEYPVGEAVRITVSPANATEFALKLRIPAWVRDGEVSVGGASTAVVAGGYAILKRTWQPGDVVELRMPLRPRLRMGTHTNVGLAAVLYGPLVLAADDRINAAKIGTFQLMHQTIGKLAFTVEPTAAGEPAWPGGKTFALTAATLQPVAKGESRDVRVRLLPFAEVGQDAAFKVWLPVWLYSTPSEAALGAPAVTID